MTEIKNKAFNTRILAALVAVAVEVWPAVHIQAGTYRAAQVAKMIGDNKNVDVYLDNSKLAKRFTERTSGDTLRPVAVSVDSFYCELTAAMVFRLVAQFEKLAGVSSAAAHKFTREEEGRIFADVYADIPKNAKILKKYVSSDELRPVMQSVAMDLRRGALVAVDGYKLAAVPCPVSGEVDPDCKYIYISPATAAKVADKRVRIVVTETTAPEYDGEKKNVNGERIIIKSGAYQTQITTADGLEITETSPAGRFPNWFTVVPNFGEGVTIEKKDRADLVKSLKTGLKKNFFPAVDLRKHEIKIDLCAGSREITVHSYEAEWDNTFTYNVPIAAMCPYSGKISMIAEDLITLLQDCDTIYFNNPDLVQGAGLIGGGVAIYMPRLRDDAETVRDPRSGAPGLDLMPPVTVDVATFSQSATTAPKQSETTEESAQQQEGSPAADGTTAQQPATPSEDAQAATQQPALVLSVIAAVSGLTAAHDTGTETTRMAPRYAPHSAGRPFAPPLPHLCSLSARGGVPGWLAPLAPSARLTPFATVPGLTAIATADRASAPPGAAYLGRGRDDPRPYMRNQGARATYNGRSLYIARANNYSFLRRGGCSPPTHHRSYNLPLPYI